MSSFFSRSSTKSGASSVTSREPPPATSEIYCTPPDGCTPKKKWEYTTDQLAQIEELKQYTSTLLLPESDEYHPWEARFLADPGTHPRYMRAAKWKMDDAKKRIKGTIEWRREYKPELIQPGDVGVEAETGKIIVTGFDLDARPILYLRPGRENTETSPRQIRHMIYFLERAIDLMPPGQEQVTIIVDSNPSISTGRKVLNILQNHYVERMGRGLVVNMPWWMNAFFSGITPLMDPITRDKIRFNPTLTELVPPSQLDWEFGGDYHFVYDYEKAWKTLTEFCHIAPDGTRKDKDGNTWYPPLGNGVKAAYDGLVPKEGAVTSGEVVHAPAGDSGEEPAQTEQRTDQSEAQKLATRTREEGAVPATVGASDTAPATVSSGSAATTGAKGEELDEIERGVTGIALGSAAGIAAATTSISNGHSSGQAQPAAAATTETASVLSNGSVATTVPDAPTKPGPPVSDLVFDHPPSTSEMKQAEEIERRSHEQAR